MMENGHDNGNDNGKDNGRSKKRIRPDDPRLPKFPSIIREPIWTRVRPYITLEHVGGDANTRVRIEVRNPPEPLRSALLKYERFCNGKIHAEKRGPGPALFHPFRIRTDGGIYFAAVCAGSVGDGLKSCCSKGWAASAEYYLVEADVEAYQKEHGTFGKTEAERQMDLGLFGDASDSEDPDDPFGKQ